MKKPIIRIILASTFVALPSTASAVDTDSDGVGDWYEVATIDSNPLFAPLNALNSAAIKPNSPHPLPAPNSTAS